MFNEYIKAYNSMFRAENFSGSRNFTNTVQ